MPRVLIAGCGYVGQADGESYFTRPDGRSKDGPPPRESAPRFAGNAVSGPRGRYSAMASECRRMPGDSMSSFIARARAEATRRLPSHLFRRGAQPSPHFSQRVDSFLPAARAFTRRQTVRGSTRPAPAEPDARNRQDFAGSGRNRARATAESSRALAGIYGPGRSFFCENFSRGKRSLTRETRSFHQSGSPGRHRCSAVRSLSSARRESRKRRSRIFNVVDDQPILPSECYTWLARELQSTRCLRREDQRCIASAATATSG